MYEVKLIEIKRDVRWAVENEKDGHIHAIFKTYEGAKEMVRAFNSPRGQTSR